MSDAHDTTIGMLFSANESVNAPQAPEPVAPSQPAFLQQEQAPINPLSETPVAPPPAAPEPQREAPRVPLTELLETRKRAQEAERQNAQLIEAMQRLTAMQQYQAPREPQPAPQVIDPVSDPEGAYAALQQQMNEGMLNMHLNMSERYARTSHGNDAVDQALQAAVQAGYADHFKNRPDPYGEMVQWHQGQRLTQEVGPDLAAFKEKLRGELRAELLASIKSGQPIPQNLPPSLAGSANAANPAAADSLTSDRDFFRQTMNPRAR